MTRILRAAWGFLAAALVVLAAPACATSDAPRPQAAVAVHATPGPAAVGRFDGKLESVELFQRCVEAKKPLAHSRCATMGNGHQRKALAHAVTFHRPDGTALTAPAGMTTDFASIPRVFWPVLPPDGEYAFAAVIHDDCYKTRGSFAWRWPNAPASTPAFIGLTGRPALSRAECDQVLREGMVALHVSAWKVSVIYGAVHDFGWIGWGS